jgi:uncharacterized integral membrane protein
MQLIVLAIVIVTLVILYLQNSVPVIALKFLGTETLAFPLAIWVVGAVVVGLLAGWLLSGLFQMVLWLTQRQLKGQVRDLQYEVTRLEAANGENWVDENDLEDRDEPAYDTVPRDFEKPQTPSPNLQDGSRYSYSYRDRPSFVPPEPPRSQELDPRDEKPQPTSKKTVDAEYRVLVPPPPESGVAPEEPEENDDWDFDDERSSDWDDHPRSSRRGWS